MMDVRLDDRDDTVELQEGEQEQKSAPMLHISPDLALPAEAVTRVFGVFAQRGAGKTYTCSVLMEEMVKHGLFVGCIDPLGVMWGIRSSRDGQQAGYPVLILGGAHGDLPLDYTAGKIVAHFVEEVRQPFILDLSLFDEQDQQCLFVSDFLLAFRRSESVLLHLIIDEADIFAPQMPQTAAERQSLKALNMLARRYRAKGFGATFITQRPALFDKSALAMVDVLLALRIVGPQDVEALDSWIKRNAGKDERAQFLATVSMLPNGVAWLWSPQWLQVFQQVAIRERETFDSSKTPEIGVLAQMPKQLAEIDLSKIGGQLSSLLEQVAEDDPQLPRARAFETQEWSRETQERHRTPGEESQPKRVVQPRTQRKGEAVKSGVERQEQGQDTASKLSQDEAWLSQVQQLQGENEQLRALVARQEQRIAALLSVTNADQQMQAERLQAANVNIERAEIHQFYSGVAVGERTDMHRSENAASPPMSVVVSALESGESREPAQPRKPLLVSQRHTLTKIREKLDKLSEVEREMLHVLLDHDGCLFTLSTLAKEMGLTYRALHGKISRANQCRGLASLPFVTAPVEKRTYMATFSKFFDNYDMQAVYELLGLEQHSVLPH